MNTIELEILEILSLKAKGKPYSLDFLLKKYNISYHDLITIVYLLINKKMVYKSFLQPSHGIISSLIFPGFEITHFGLSYLKVNQD